MDYKEPLKNVNSVPTTPLVRYPILLGSAILIAFLGVLIFWSVEFPLDKAAIAQGQIVVETESKSIQHLEGGIIKKILVNDGQMVQSGQPLIILDDTQAKADAAISYNEYLTLLAKVARLTAEKNDAATIQFPDELVKAAATNQDFADIIKAQQAIFDDNNLSFKKSIASLNEKIVYLQAQVKNLDDQVQAEQERLVYAEKELEAANQLGEKNYIGKADIWKLNELALSVKSDINKFKAEEAQAKQGITQAQLQIITETNDRREKTLDDFDKAQTALQDVLEKYKAKKDVFERTVIRSPINGTVVNLQFHTIGGVIRPGEVILEIVPQNDVLIVKAQLNPRDIDMVHKGMLAKVQLLAYSSRRTPMVKGVVTEVSADVLKNVKTGEPYYEIKVVIDQSELQALKQLRDVILYPGMPVQVSVIVRQRTLFDYLITPLINSFGRAFKED